MRVELVSSDVLMQFMSSPDERAAGGGGGGNRCSAAEIARVAHAIAHVRANTAHDPFHLLKTLTVGTPLQGITHSLVRSLPLHASK